MEKEKSLLEQLLEYKLKQIMDPFWEQFETDMLKRLLSDPDVV
jgi:hypothetical protein